jgi:hypothetical protein
MEISPFDNITGNAIYLEPILDPISQEYKIIITLDAVPSGPLSTLVFPIRTPELSIFSSRHREITCKYMLSRYTTSKCFMHEDDIPAIFAYLQQNGYTIDKNLTKLYQDKTAKPRVVICIFTYTG